MARPSVRLPPPLAAALAERAARERVTESHVARAALAAYLGVADASPQRLATPERAWAMHLAGLDRAAIARALGEPGQPLSRQRVAQLLARARKALESTA